MLAPVGTLSFYNKLRIAQLFNDIVIASKVIIGALCVLEALGVFLIPKIVYAEESLKQKLVKQVEVVPEYKYEIKIHEFLDLQKDFGNPDSAYQALDHLLGKIDKKIIPRSKYNKKEAIEALKAIGRLLKEEGNFEYRKNILLIEGLKRQESGTRFIDCDDYSSLYLFAGERLGLSLNPVYASNHVFLECQLDEITHFYWEPTIGEEKDACFYKTWLNIPEDSSYPKILNEKEFEAIQFSNLGAAWYEKGNYEKSIEYSKRALGLNPDYASALNNLGAAYSKQGKFDVALACYEKAIDLEPNHATALNNIGVAFYKLGYLEKAVEYFEKAIKVDPGYDKAYAYEVVALIKGGKHKQALNLLSRISNLKKKTANQPKS